MSEEDVKLDIKPEETNEDKSEPEKKKQDQEAKKEEEAKVPFSCVKCQLSENCHYFGKTPPFVKKQLKFHEDTFVMLDPFSPRQAGRANFLIIGGICSICQQNVCVDCSIFYGRRFCDNCAYSHFDEFPTEVQMKLRKKS